MATKLLPLRRADSCSKCGAGLTIGTKAWWDGVAKKVECVTCNAGGVTSTPHLPPLAPPPPPIPVLDIGRAGVSAAKEYERRAAKHERQIETTWGTGRIGKVAKFFSEEPQSTKAWATGADGERRVSGHLRRELGDRAIMLDDRKVPGGRGNIDHLVIASSGVWVIDAKKYTGRVERRDVGGWRKVDDRLFVNGREQTKLAVKLGWQIDAVRKVMSKAGLVEVPIHSALCFTNSEWGMFAKPFQIGGVWVTWAQKLVELIVAPSEVTVVDREHAALTLGIGLPASG